MRIEAQEREVQTSGGESVESAVYSQLWSDAQSLLGRAGQFLDSASSLLPDLSIVDSASGADDATQSRSSSSRIGDVPGAKIGAPDVEVGDDGKVPNKNGEDVTAQKSAKKDNQAVNADRSVSPDEPLNNSIGRQLEDMEESDDTSDDGESDLIHETSFKGPAKTDSSAAQPLPGGKLEDSHPIGPHKYEADKDGLVPNDVKPPSEGGVILL